MSIRDRFPTLYHDIVDERGTDGKVTEKKTPKPNLPTLHDVVDAVLVRNRVHDTGLASDLTSTVQEFLEESRPKDKKKEPKAE